MNYTQSITRRHRTAFLIAIDQSGSMAEELTFRGVRRSKASAVAEVTNSLLSELLLRATREGEVRDYYDIAVIGYSGDGVQSLLAAGTPFIAVPHLEESVRNLRRITVERHLPDGQPALNDLTLREWILPEATGQTPMYEALCYVRDLAEGWCARPEHRESFPPLIFNITDGEASDEYWQRAQWDGSEGVAPQGAATWVWLANVDHLYFKRTSHPATPKSRAFS